MIGLRVFTAFGNSIRQRRHILGCRKPAWALRVGGTGFAPESAEGMEGVMLLGGYADKNPVYVAAGTG